MYGLKIQRLFEHPRFNEVGQRREQPRPRRHFTCARMVIPAAARQVPRQEAMQHASDIHNCSRALVYTSVQGSFVLNGKEQIGIDWDAIFCPKRRPYGALFPWGISEYALHRRQALCDFLYGTAKTTCAKIQCLVCWLRCSFDFTSGPQTSEPCWKNRISAYVAV